jgi:hypothetical protein
VICSNARVRGSDFAKGLSSLLCIILLSACGDFYEGSQVRCETMGNDDLIRVSKYHELMQNIEQQTGIPRFGVRCDEDCYKVTLWLSSQFGVTAYQLSGQPRKAWDGLIAEKRFKLEIARVHDGDVGIESSFELGDGVYVVTRLPLPVDKVDELIALFEKLPDRDCRVKPDGSLLDGGMAYLFVQENEVTRRYAFPFDHEEWDKSHNNNSLVEVSSFIRENMRTDR